MKKLFVSLLILLIVNIPNVIAKPTPSEATKYDKKQDIKINKNTKAIDKETDKRKLHDNKLNNKILNEKDNRIKGDNKLNDKIITNTDNIITNTDSITSNYNKNKTQNLDIKANSNNINSNSRKIESLDNRLSELEETQTIVGLEGRIYDSKKWEINVFADYSTNRNKVDRTGIRFTYKFGKSYEEKKIEELERKLNKLIKEEK